MKIKHTILVVEDERDVRQSIEQILAGNDFISIGMESAENALKKLQTLKPNLILIDIQLAGMNGLDFCKKIRSEPDIADIPVIFLSAHSSDAYKITALDTGADDFISKPFSPGELLARIRAVLRRTAQHKPLPKHILKDKNLTLDMKSRMLLTEDKTIPLSPKEFDLMSFFMKSQGKVLSRDFLATHVWEREHLKNSRTIDVHISRLRKTLGRYGAAIKTIGKVGYRYIPE